MLTEQMRSELEPMLRGFNNDDDFVFGVLDRLKSDDEGEVMVRFINTAGEFEDVSITQDELILLSIYLADNGPDVHV